MLQNDARFDHVTLDGELRREAKLYFNIAELKKRTRSCVPNRSFVDSLRDLVVKRAQEFESISQKRHELSTP